MISKNTAIRVTAMLMCSGVLYAKETDVVLVKRGETFSQIAYKYFGIPVYRENDGALSKLARMNPKIENLDLIYAGDKIKIPRRKERGIASESIESHGAQDVPPIEAPLLPEPTPQQPEVILAQPREAQPEIKAEVASGSSPPPTAKMPIKTAPEKTDSADDGFPVSHLGVDAGFKYFSINATQKSNGAPLNLVSNLVPQTQATWDLDWSKEWTSRLRFSYQGESIQDITGSTQRTIQDSSSSRYGIEAGVVRNWNPSTRTELALTFEERDFVHVPNPTTIAVDHVMSPALKVSQEIDLARVRSASMGVEISGEVISGGSGPGYTVNGGYGAGGSIYLKHEGKNICLSGRVGYGIEQQNTTLLNQKETHLGGLLGITWKFGD